MKIVFCIPGDCWKSTRQSPALFLQGCLRTLVISFLLNVLIPESLRCQDTTALHQRIDIQEISRIVDNTICDTSLYRPLLLFEDASLTMIHWYQNDVATQSIQRCPFVTSCSKFTEIAIKRYGFIQGICLFIDRNLYRENSEMYQLYERYQLPNGVLKLNDDYYLSQDH